MSTISLTLVELGAVVFAAIVLAATDASAISRLGVTFAAKRLGVSPGEIYQYDQATDGDANS
jgi:hypothetical protein